MVRSPRFVAVAVALAVTAATASSQRRDPRCDDFSGPTVAVPGFAISIELSPQAEKRLDSLRETIKILAMFDGDPLPGQGCFNAPMRDVYLGSGEKLVDANNVADFSDLKVSQHHWNELADKDYYVTINVFSARKKYKNNLLDCGVPEGHISAFAGKTTEVRCWLIGEPDAPNK
jgi:hypothetical protein